MIPLTRLKALRGRHQFIRKYQNYLVLIWSAEHHAWWREGRCGYTAHKEAAGLYTLEDAYDATSHCGPEKKIHYQFFVDEKA